MTNYFKSLLEKRSFFVLIALSLLFFSCQSPYIESDVQDADGSVTIAGPGREITTVSYFPFDTVIWSGVENHSEFMRLISEREEIEVDAIKIADRSVFDERIFPLIKNFDLQKESEHGRFSKYSGKVLELNAEGENTSSLAFEQLGAVSLDGFVLQDLTLEEFKNRYPKAYQVRNFGTKADSKIITTFTDDILPPFDYSFLYLKDKAELRLFWVEGRLVEAYLVFGQQQRVDF